MLDLDVKKILGQRCESTAQVMNVVSLATLPNFVPKEMALRKVEAIKATARAMAGNEEVSEGGSHTRSLGFAKGTNEDWMGRKIFPIRHDITVTCLESRVENIGKQAMIEHWLYIISDTQTAGSNPSQQKGHASSGH